jgi:hypothetical protein
MNFDLLNGYWWIFVVINDYYIIGYWWILVVINDYYISGYWWILVVINVIMLVTTNVSLISILYYFWFFCACYCCCSSDEALFLRVNNVFLYYKIINPRYEKNEFFI